MKTLYLLRHAHAEDSAPPPLGDHERALSARGEKEAEAVATFLEGRNVCPGFVLSSSSVRTLQTVRLIYARLLKDEGTSVHSHFDRALYLAPAETLLQYIAAVGDEAENLLAVAHNPGVAELAYALSRGTLSDHTQDFPTAALAVFRINAKSWGDISPKTATLEKVFTP